MVTRACLRYAREGQNVTQAGPKCHTSRAKMSHKGQNVTQSCYNNSLRPSDAYKRQKTNNHWFRQWLVAWSAPNHYLNQRYNFDNSNLSSKRQWNIKRTACIFIKGNAFENVVWEMAAICVGHTVLNSVRYIALPVFNRMYYCIRMCVIKPTTCV